MSDTSSNSHHPTGTISLMMMLLVDQQVRWRRGERVLVEAYLEQQPTLSNDREAVLELLLHEVSLRRERGEMPAPAEYQRRFPHLTEPLALRFAPMRAVQDGEVSVGTTPHADSIHGIVSTPPPSHPTVPGYETLGELGRGGMGVVYKARQRNFNRIVGLKMVLAGGHSNSEERRRFLVEAEAIAAIEHPGIVRVFEFGTHAGLPYFSMEFCEGGSLTAKLAGGPLPAGSAADMVEQVARAVQAAHEKGIIHRDLKPQNVLLDNHGRPKISDFGLAKRIESGPGLTQTGAVMGTPSYMAPEQALSKKDVGPAADVYSIGAILYECLTGRPPFKAATIYDTLRQVVNDEAVPPRRLNDAVPLDLETVCSKCLHKDPAKRYGSAAGVADDLRHFLAGEPIRARPVGSVERGMRWVRRNPLVAGLVAALIAALTVGVISTTLFALVARSEARRANDKADEADREAKAAIRAEGDARREAQTAREREYGASMASVRHAWGEHLIHRFVSVLDAQIPHSDQVDYRNFEWHYWRKLLRSGHFTLAEGTGWVNGVAFSPDGKWLASAVNNGTVRVWEVSTRRVARTLGGHGSAFSSVAYSSDGKWLAAGCQDKTVKIWVAATGKEHMTLEGHTGPVRCVAFSPDGRWLASGGTELKWWNTMTGQERFEMPKGPKSFVCSVAFSPNGKWLTASYQNGTLRWWDAESGNEIPELEGHEIHGRAPSMTSLAFSTDSRRLVSGGGWTAKVWESGTKTELQTFNRHDHWVTGVAFSSDGKRVASVGHNQTLKIWDAMTGNELLNFQSHTAGITSVTFSPDGKSVATGSRDGTVKVWDAVQGQRPRTLKAREHAGGGLGLSFSPDGTRVASRDGASAVKVWNVKTSEEVVTIEGMLGKPSFSPDGKRLIGTDRLANVKQWDAVTGREEPTWKPIPLKASSYKPIVVSRDGTRFAAHAAKNRVKMWDLTTGKEVFDVSGPSNGAAYLAISPDGKQIASGADLVDAERPRWVGGAVKIWDVSTGHERFTFDADRERVHELVFSPDGQRLAAACHDGTVKVWDTATGRLAQILRGHTTVVFGVAFSPDGKRLASASWDNTVMLWDTATGLEVLTLRGYPSGVGSVAFSPDGKRLAATGDSGIVMIWDADSGE